MVLCRTGCHSAGVQQLHTAPLGPEASMGPFMVSRGFFGAFYGARLTEKGTCCSCCCSQPWMEDRERSPEDVGPKTAVQSCPCSQVSYSQVFCVVPIHFTGYARICMWSTNTRRYWWETLLGQENFT